MKIYKTIEIASGELPTENGEYYACKIKDSLSKIDTTYLFEDNKFWGVSGANITKSIEYWLKPIEPTIANLIQIPEFKEELKKWLGDAFDKGKTIAQSDNRNYNQGYDKDHPRYDKNADIEIQDYINKTLEQ